MATPAVVVEQRHDLLALWLPDGARGKRAEGDIFEGWTLRDHVFRRPHGLVRLTRPGDDYSVLLFRDEDGEFEGWYINLEEPLVAAPLGWDFEDHVLDVWIEPSGAWRWLDEDEFEEAVRRGVFSESKASEIRAAGERALERAFAEQLPFGEGWETWRPDPAWPVPVLPHDWDAM